LINVIGLAVAMAGAIQSVKRSLPGNQAARGILHVPYTYFPDPCGGTEVYVRGLAQRLSAHGYANAVAAPAAASATYEHAGLPVHRFATDLRPRLDLAYGVPDEIAAEGFRAIVAQARPDIVHLHACTAAVSERLVDVAHAAGARVVFTYHTPTASCARGTMMLFGETPCDGFIETKRCTACTLAGLGVWKPVAETIGTLSAVLRARVAEKAARLGLPKALRIPPLIASHRRAFDRFMGKIDHVVAVCQWVYDLLVRNGVQPDKITLSRQGIAQPAQPSWPRASRPVGEPLRLAYFGRIDRAKGPDLLARALALIPHANVRVDFFVVRQDCGKHLDYDWLVARSHEDMRIALNAPVPPVAVTHTMADYDLIAVPSRWLETGPLVVLEAFAARVPVLGADLGGIIELVRDGVDGILVAADDPEAWAATIARLAEDRSIVDALHAGILPPRSMDAAADDMAKIYAQMLGEAEP
jgi:glycosyltransferase involved in cell wall biosynthesis